MDVTFQVLCTHQHTHKYVLDLVSDCAVQNILTSNNLALTEILKIIKRQLVKTAFKQKSSILLKL